MLFSILAVTIESGFILVQDFFEREVGTAGDDEFPSGFEKPLL